MNEHHDSRTFRRAVGAARKARSFVVASLRAAECGHAARLIEDAALLVSELVTNVVLHTLCEELTVEVAASPAGHIRCSVIDHAPGSYPEVQPLDPSTVGGNGLVILDRLATRWGWHRHGSAKVVWFELDPEPA